MNQIGSRELFIYPIPHCFEEVCPLSAEYLVLVYPFVQWYVVPVPGTVVIGSLVRSFASGPKSEPITPWSKVQV